MHTAAAPLRWEGLERVLHPIEVIFAVYMGLLALLALGAWLVGGAGPSALAVFAGFYGVNAAISFASRRSRDRARAGALRVGVAALLAPAAYLLAGDPFMRWWPAFLIMCLVGTALVCLQTGKARLARPLTAYYLGLYALAEAAAPPPHDWYMLATNAGAIAFVSLLFGEIVAFLGATLAGEREQRAAQFRSLIQNGSDIITVVEPEGGFQYVSPAFERVLGYPPEEVIGTHFLGLIHPQDAPGLQERIASAIANPGVVLTHQFRARHKNGGWRTLESYGRLEPGDSVLITNSRDITDRREAEEALRSLNAELEHRVAERTADLERSLGEQRRLAAIIEATSDYVGIADLQGRSLYVNRAGLRMIGKRREDMRGAEVARCYPERELPKAGEMVAAALRGEVWSGEITLRHADGHEFPVSEVTFAVPGADGRPQYLATIIRDISAQKRAESEITGAKEAAESALAESRRLASIIEATTDLVGTADMQFRVTYMNRAGRRLMGFGDDESLEGFSMTEAYPPDEFRRIAEEVIPAALREGRDATLFDTRIQTRAGQEIPVSIVGIFHRGANGAPTHLSAVIRDTSVQKRTEEELKRAKDAAEGALAEQRRLTEILEATSDFVGIAEPSGRVLYINRAGRRMIGFDAAADVRTLDFGRIFTREGIAAINQRGVPAALREGAWQEEIELRHADGRLVPTSFVGLVHCGADGAPGLLSCVARDITERKRAEKKLRRAKDAAEAANRAKSAFLATMSHEIRTPMNAVIGMTSLLLETPLSPRQREFVETVRVSGDALLTVINDILDFSKIEADKLELAPRPFVLRHTIDAVLDLLAPRAGEKGLELACIVEDGVPAGIVADETRLRQILVNLVGNAIKFTPSGEVVVQVAGRPGDGLAFAVRDTGPGIPAGKTERLFQSFSQLDSSATREHGGTGLGLAISRRLAELMGGRMWVESEGVPGRGATFHFTIRAEAAAVSDDRHLRAGALPELRGKRVLVVDDNPTNRRILSLQARGWGMEPVEAADAAEALERVRSGEPLDLAILDMQLSARAGAPADGVALAEAICALRGERRLPLVMLTSVGSATRAEAEAIRCFQGWLSKPVKPSQLYNVLAGALAPQPAPVAAAPAPAAAPLAERMPLRILLAEDVALNQRFALLALEQLGYCADVAANGLEAVQAIERQPYDVILMDVQMPELDGLEATRRIRRLHDGVTQPYIVAMTANAMQGDREACLQSGMDDYVSKPVYLAELRAALERAAAGRPAPRAIRAEALASLAARLDGGELVALYAAEAARYAAELRRALEARDAGALARAAHDLKGSSGYVGADRLVELCRRLEQKGREGTLEGAAPLVAWTEKEIDRVRQALCPAAPA